MSNLYVHVVVRDAESSSRGIDPTIHVSSAGVVGDKRSAAAVLRTMANILDPQDTAMPYVLPPGITKGRPFTEQQREQDIRDTKTDKWDPVEEEKRHAVLRAMDDRRDMEGT